jgi:soluble lytic murein transglycosylase-like protein
MQFWEAKVAECNKNVGRALNLYKDALTRLNPRSDASLAIHAAERVLQIHRSSGDREAAANAYIDLMTALSARTPDAQAVVGETPLEFRLKHINYALWAARHRAMVADYLGAKNYIHEAFDLIAKTYVQFNDLSKASRQKLMVFKAEAYHALAFRIAVEQQDYEGALAQVRLAQQITDLDKEWTERFSWFSGLYLYLTGNREQAILAWEAMLRADPDEDLKPQLLFWLARLHALQKRGDLAARYLNTLMDRYPLNFYAVVAPALTGLAAPTLWQERFGTIAGLKMGLRRNGLSAKVLRREAEISRLTTRAEILAGADAGEWARLAVTELHASLRKTATIAQAPDAYVALSRMFYRVSDYNQAMTLTTQLAQAHADFWDRYPEQLLVYYARPFSDVFERKALESYLDRDWLYAVSRQESGFRPEVESPAGARGLMQLILPTAQRYAAELGINSPDLAKRLYEPETNISLGAAYLRTLTRLYKGQEAAIFGAYNAGEYIMDTWIKRRAHPDPMTWIELVPFGETKGYIRSVWRNLVVYKHLGSAQPRFVRAGTEDFRRF